jgi:aldehyde dehydrogenase (NAD+)
MADPAGTVFPATWEYSPAPESMKVEVPASTRLWIGGTWVEPHSRKRFPTVNPATEATLSQVAEADAHDVDAAVAAARKAFRGWSRLPARERAKYLYRIARRIQERSRELAVLETMDGGKPIKESRDVDVPLAAQHFFHHAGWCDKLRYAVPGGGDPRPVGVCGQVIPWNFPLLMAAWKLAPALACGNTVVLKPAETTSLTAVRLAEILEECELPPGVVNIVTGAGATGRALVEHAGIDKVAFTGSTEVGKLIAKGCAARGTRLTLELGGKSPNIIFADAAIDQAIEGIVQGIWFNQGHVCCAGSRLFVEESVLPEVVRKLEIRMRSLRVGDPLDKNTDVGAINSTGQLATIMGYIEAGAKEGCTVCQPGQQALPAKGYWCRPTFMTGVQPSHVVAREEIFGPVLVMIPFKDMEEAIAIANDTPYGLAAYLHTGDLEKGRAVARRLRAGSVHINGAGQGYMEPFGGFKQSGNGRECGAYGLLEFLELKSINGYYAA